MSLSQLLVVGKSIEGGKDTPCPYRINDDKALPRFAPVGRPISLAVPPKASAEAIELFQPACKPRQPIPAPPLPQTAPVARRLLEAAFTPRQLEATDGVTGVH